MPLTHSTFTYPNGSNELTGGIVFTHHDWLLRHHCGRSHNCIGMTSNCHLRPLSIFQQTVIFVAILTGQLFLLSKGAIHVRIVSMMILLIHLQGCIAIPYFPAPAFKESEISNIVKQGVSQDFILAQFGEPFWVLNNLAFIYIKSKASGFIAAKDVFGTMYDNDFLIIYFNEKYKVSAYEIRIGDSRHKSTWSERQSFTFDVQSELGIAPVAYDQEAKLHKAVQGKCVIYFYRAARGMGGSYASKEPIDVLVDHVVYGTSMNNRYSRWIIPPNKFIEIHILNFSGTFYPMKTYPIDIDSLDTSESTPYYGNSIRFIHGGGRHKSIILECPINTIRYIRLFHPLYAGNEIELNVIENFDKSLLNNSKLALDRYPILLKTKN